MKIYHIKPAIHNKSLFDEQLLYTLAEQAKDVLSLQDLKYISPNQN
jgi:hypothetical protein